MKRLFTLSPLLFLLLSLATLLSGCSLFGSPFQETTKFKSSKVENPFFYLPPENLKDYQNRTWILLAESKNKNWFYDPYSIFEDQDQIVSFDMFVTERGYEDKLHPFNSTSIGPYKQKIDCFGNYQWSEIFYAQGMPNQETYTNPLKPNQEWGWIKIKPKTSMAYIRARICGRKFLDEKNVNYFLFQDGKLPFVKEKAKTPQASKTSSPKCPPEGWLAKFGLGNNCFDPSVTEAWLESFRVEDKSSDSTKKELSSSPKDGIPIFYEVINNEVLVLDAKRNLRQMRIASYYMDKDFTKRGDLIFQANCQANTYTLSVAGKSSRTEVLSDLKDDLPNIAFNRACGEHGAYMRYTSRAK